MSFMDDIPSFQVPPSPPPSSPAISRNFGSKRQVKGRSISINYDQPLSYSPPPSPVCLHENRNDLNRVPLCEKTLHMSDDNSSPMFLDPQEESTSISKAYSEVGKKIKRKRRKRESIVFWKLTTLMSPDFDPKRLTERQQMAMIRKKEELVLDNPLNANIDFKDVAQLCSPFVMDQKDDIYNHWTQTANISHKESLSPIGPLFKDAGKLQMTAKTTDDNPFYSASKYLSKRTKSEDNCNTSSSPLLPVDHLNILSSVVLSSDSLDASNHKDISVPEAILNETSFRDDPLHEFRFITADAINFHGPILSEPFSFPSSYIDVLAAKQRDIHLLESSRFWCYASHILSQTSCCSDIKSLNEFIFGIENNPCMDCFHFLELADNWNDMTRRQAHELESILSLQPI